MFLEISSSAWGCLHRWQSLSRYESFHHCTHHHTRRHSPHLTLMLRQLPNTQSAHPLRHHAKS